MPRPSPARSSPWPRALLIVAAGFFAPPARADEPPFRRTEDVIYGRKSGSALTLDVFQPRSARNGLGVIAVISGGWISGHEGINPAELVPWTDRGYTVFAVVHGSQPRYTIPDAVADLNRATRFVRAHARDWAIDPERLGIFGFSAGGHLSLMVGTAGGPGDPAASDPVDRESSRVAVVGCFFPPTDFLNYGRAGEAAIGTGPLRDYAAPFDFRMFDPERRRLLPVADPERIRAIARDISPINHVSADDPPTLIIHGAADTLVPIQQGEIMVARLRAAGVDARLVARPGRGHGWAGMERDIPILIAWFDDHLKPSPVPSSGAATEPSSGAPR